MRKIFKEFKCNQCRLNFKPDNNGMWTHTDENGNIKEMICPACYKKWEDSYKFEEVKFYNQNGQSFIEIRQPGSEHWSTLLVYISGGMVMNNSDLWAWPESYMKKLYAEYEKHCEEKRKKTLSNFDITENYEENYISWSTFGDERGKLHFKYGKGGQVIFKPEEWAKVPDYVQEQINQKMEVK